MDIGHAELKREISELDLGVSIEIHINSLPSELVLTFTPEPDYQK